MAKKIFIILSHGLVGWGLCGAIIGIGRTLTSMDNTLMIHLIAVPIIFGGISWFYMVHFHYTSPLNTACLFLGLAILLDAGIVAPFMEKSFEMFSSVLGTWIPFGLIFLSSYLTGWVVLKHNRNKLNDMIPSKNAEERI